VTISARCGTLGDMKALGYSLLLFVPFTLGSTGCSDSSSSPTKTQAAATAHASETPSVSQTPHEADEPLTDECLHGDGGEGSCAPPSDPSTKPNVEPGHYGAAFTVDSEQTLASAIEDFATTKDQQVRVTGTVGPVCQKKGCWMVLKDGEHEARVLMANHAFAVPMDGEGRKAVVEGQLTSREFSAAQVRHIDKDAGREPSADATARTEYVVTATAVKMLRS